MHSRAYLKYHSEPIVEARLCPENGNRWIRTGPFVSYGKTCPTSSLSIDYGCDCRSLVQHPCLHY